MGVSRSYNGRYTARIVSEARWLSTPITTRSGWRKSPTAEPSRRNSGLDTTLNSVPFGLASSMMAATLRAVPTGAVLFWTTTV